MDELTALLQGLPGAELITDGMKQAALDQAVVPDSEGRWPGTEGYVATYDVYYAVLPLLSFLAAQPVVTQASSEGTSVTATGTNWGALANYFRGLSTVAQKSAQPVLGVIAIPHTPHVRRTDMSGRWDQHGDVDTDLG